MIPLPGSGDRDAASGLIRRHVSIHLKTINVLRPRRSTLISRITLARRDYRRRYIARALYKHGAAAQHQLQLNRNMTKVNAPCVVRGRATKGAADGALGTWRANQWRVEADAPRHGARRADFLPPLAASSRRGVLLLLIVPHSIGLASGAVHTQRRSPAFMHRECTIVTSDVSEGAPQRAAFASRRRTSQIRARALARRVISDRYLPSAASSTERA